MVADTGRVAYLLAAAWFVVPLAVTAVVWLALAEALDALVEIRRTGAEQVQLQRELVELAEEADRRAAAAREAAEARARARAHAYAEAHAQAYARAHAHALRGGQAEAPLSFAARR
jgi:flagellar biosynthesis/type III secretory pathway protein FliH